jgi:hypothetical protein
MVRDKDRDKEAPLRLRIIRVLDLGTRATIRLKDGVDLRAGVVVAGILVWVRTRVRGTGWILKTGRIPVLELP